MEGLGRGVCSKSLRLFRFVETVSSELVLKPFVAKLGTLGLHHEPELHAIFARPLDLVTWPKHLGFMFFAVERRSS